MTARVSTVSPFGAMASAQAGDPRLAALEWLTLAQVGTFLIACTWAFGGNAAWVQLPLACWGTVGGAITFAVLLGGEEFAGVKRRKLVDLWPLLLFNALVLIASLTPNFREILLGGDSIPIPREVPAWRPSSARPGLALWALWMFDATYLSCFNLAMCVRHRRALRGLLLLSAGNAVALAAFGTVQKLMGAPGPYFGLYPSPQPNFFSSFVYANHWAALMILMIAVGLGLAWHYAPRWSRASGRHSPAFGAVAAVVLLAASVPLSGSRSGTLILAFVLGCAVLHWIVATVRSRRKSGRSAAGPIAGGLAAAALSVAAILYLDSNVVAARFALTRSQLATMRAEGGIGSRMTLYRDTWRMARDKLWFGWGMGSYPLVFNLYSTQAPNPLDHLPIFYHDAHNDWLQSAAENGLAGTALLCLCALVPLRRLRRMRKSQWMEPLVFFLLGGCLLVLLYAGIEFPFGNPAVVLTWWMCFFCAVRLADLRRHGGPDSGGSRPLATSSGPLQPATH